MATSEAALAHKKEYNKEYYQANKEKLAEKLAEYRAANKERLAAHRKAHYEANKEQVAAYAKAYRGANKEKVHAYERERYIANREKKIAAVRAYRHAHKESGRAYTQAYQQANPGKMNAKAAKRRSAKLQRTPNWLTPNDYHAIRTLYETAAALTKSTGIEHHVDHIIPLQGRTVSGFHCPTNLQILTQSENCSKNNKFTGEH
jgi:5-methylcytosine-specific restriction endonuclease McrA